MFVRLSHRRYRRAPWLVLIAAIVMVISGCQVTAPVTAPPWDDNMGPGPITEPYPDVAPEVWANRGSVIRLEPLAEDLDPALADVVGQATRAVYASVFGLDGSPTEVSGSFFIPKGSPPARRMANRLAGSRDRGYGYELCAVHLPGPTGLFARRGRTGQEGVRGRPRRLPGPRDAGNSSVSRASDGRFQRHRCRPGTARDLSRYFGALVGTGRLSRRPGGVGG